jgi:hypothetical protein
MVDITSPNICSLEYQQGSDTPWAINELSVTIANPTPVKSLPQLNSCVPSSSIGVLVQKPLVTAYVAKANWFAGSYGVDMVPIEPPGGTPVAVTPQPADYVNSCASNSVTAETVCVDDSTGVYLITGSKLTSTLTSDATQIIPFFSGNKCWNCGVVIDAVNNQAFIEVGLQNSPSGSGVQIIDLHSNTKFPPFPFQQQISENIQFDPFHYDGTILSPGATNYYELITNPSFLFEHLQQLTPPPPPPRPSGNLDSAAEDCTTGIALSTLESPQLPGIWQWAASPYLFIADLTQAMFSFRGWTAPEQFVYFPEFSVFQYGTDGIAVAPGSQLGVVTSEAGDPHIAVVQLPSMSVGTPNFVDYVVTTMPDISENPLTPFYMGADPHTVAAYLNPNDGLPYALVTSWTPFFSRPTHIGVVNLQMLLDAPRFGCPGATCTHFVDPSYDMTKAVRYIELP